MTYGEARRYLGISAQRMATLLGMGLRFYEDKEKHRKHEPLQRQAVLALDRAIKEHFDTMPRYLTGDGMERPLPERFEPFLREYQELCWRHRVMLDWDDGNPYLNATKEPVLTNHLEQLRRGNQKS